MNAKGPASPAGPFRFASSAVARMRPATGQTRLPAVRSSAAAQLLPLVIVVPEAEVAAPFGFRALRGFAIFDFVTILPRPGARLAGVAARAAEVERDFVLRAAGFFAAGDLLVILAVLLLVTVFAVFAVFAMVVLSPLPSWQADPSARTNHVHSPHRCFGPAG